MRRHQEEYQQIQEADGADRGTEPTTAANAEAAPLVAPENQEKFQLLVSQWLEGDIDHEQQPQQQQQEEEQQQQHQQQEEQLQQQQQQQEEQQQQQQQQQGQQQG
ncbi:hypothetical protein EMWEY_00059690 [Eimeria maxima]|uniref:Uncharacterized protein n=1 Tax=Eimeria maxima TaxID=5804 RepID=U6MEE8_EIMMA|nr:hypothetical protein EMWEY_00059690 [Eimeria maxima]CDJ60020.1 hypothetical protein EMWEY_00059690 [Eimeria maxima]